MPCLRNPRPGKRWNLTARPRVVGRRRTPPPNPGRRWRRGTHPTLCRVSVLAAYGPRGLCPASWRWERGRCKGRKRMGGKARHADPGTRPWGGGRSSHPSPQRRSIMGASGRLKLDIVGLGGSSPSWGQASRGAAVDIFLEGFCRQANRIFIPLGRVCRQGASERGMRVAKGQQPTRASISGDRSKERNGN